MNPKKTSGVFQKAPMEAARCEPLPQGSFQKLLRDFGGVGPVFLEDAGGRKFAELVADHVFGDEHGVENLPVVNEEGVADKVGDNHGAARPCFDRFFDAARHFVNFFQEVLFYERPFFE
jgi:hypothetical protein